MAPYLTRVVLAALLVPLAGCFVGIATSPSGFNQANIIVIVRTHGSGDPVTGARVTIHSGRSAGALNGGTTDGEGRYVVTMAQTSEALRAVVEIPTGFSAPAAKAGSLDVMIPSGSDHVTVWLQRDP